MNRILYIQHAGAIGGSAISLRLTLANLDRSHFTPIVGLVKPSEAMHRLYSDINVTTVPMPDITTYEHTTGRHWNYMNPAHWSMRLMQRHKVEAGAQATVRHVKSISPDLVHLNSVVLLPSAVGLSRSNIPFVWHVREHPVQGLFGQRFRFVRRHLMRLGNEILFLSKADRSAWLGGPLRGVVFPNYVDFDAFALAGDRASARSRLGLPSKALAILFVGGISEIKGTIPFLHAMRHVLKRFPDLRILMPLPPPSPNSTLSGDVRLAHWLLPKLGMGTYFQRAITLLHDSHLAPAIDLLQAKPTNIANMYLACDVLVFPHTKPHFARPVIEAAAAGRPAVASDLPGIRELIVPGETGLLVKPNDFISLTATICELLTKPIRIMQMGDYALKHAKSRYSIHIALTRLQDIYAHILNEQA